MISKNLIAYMFAMILVFNCHSNALSATHDWKQIANGGGIDWYMAPSAMSFNPNIFSNWLKLVETKTGNTSIVILKLYCDTWKYSITDVEKIFEKKTSDKLYLPDDVATDIIKGTIMADIFYSFCSEIKDGGK